MTDVITAQITPTSNLKNLSNLRANIIIFLLFNGLNNIRISLSPVCVRNADGFWERIIIYGDQDSDEFYYMSEYKLLVIGANLGGHPAEINRIINIRCIYALIPMSLFLYILNPATQLYLVQSHLYHITIFDLHSGPQGFALCISGNGVAASQSLQWTDDMQAEGGSNLPDDVFVVAR